MTIRSILNAEIPTRLITDSDPYFCLVDNRSITDLELRDDFLADKLEDLTTVVDASLDPTQVIYNHIPDGWTIVRNSFGDYTIHHNTGISPENLSIALTSLESDIPTLAVVTDITSMSFRINLIELITYSLVDGRFSANIVYSKPIEENAFGNILLVGYSSKTQHRNLTGAYGLVEDPTNWTTVMGPTYWDQGDFIWTGSTYTSTTSGDKMYATAATAALGGTKIKFTYSTVGTASPGFCNISGVCVYFTHSPTGTWTDVSSTIAIEEGSSLAMNLYNTGSTSIVITNIEIA
jgi:hypothetical protein